MAEWYFHSSDSVLKLLTLQKKLSLATKLILLRQVIIKLRKLQGEM